MHLLGLRRMNSIAPSLPLEVELAMGSRTISKVEIDEALVRNTHLLRNNLEVLDRVFIKPKRDLLLELCRIGILSGFRKVVLFAHGAPSTIKPGFASRGLSRGYDTDHFAISAIAMTHEK
jgi:hypothetical protein